MNNRDHKIAKRLHNSINHFFHQQVGIELIIEHVEMSDRKNAQIYYSVTNISPINSFEEIRNKHEAVLSYLPKIKKHLAMELNLKAIPNLHFSPTISQND
jgi:ribosome-binding factor A